MASSDLTLTELRLFSSDVEQSQAFLEEAMPAVARPTDDEGTGAVTYVPVAAGGSASSAEANDDLDGFWKYSVFCDDVGVSRSRVQATGIDVSGPTQFGDIGCLCHFTEPGGNEVELLQRTFHHSPRTQPDRPDTLGLVTLRVTDVAASANFYRSLGMSLWATMAVEVGPGLDSVVLANGNPEGEHEILLTDEGHRVVVTR